MKNLSSRKIIVMSAIFSALQFVTPNAFAQGNLSDYQRAFSLSSRIADKVYKQRVTPHFFDDNIRFWYKNNLPNEKCEFILVNAQTGNRKFAFDHAHLATALGNSIGQEVSPEKLPIDKLNFNDSTSHFSFTCKGNRYKCNLQTYELLQLAEDKQISGSAQPSYRIRPSTGSTEETWITFINQTKSDIQIYWINTEKQRQHYKLLNPGQKHRQHTFTGHVWLVTDPQGKKGALFTATPDQTEAVITEEILNEKINQASGPRKNQPQAKSPDGKWSVSIKDHNLHLKNLQNDNEFALTNNGTEKDTYRSRFFWSPDSKKLVALHLQKGDDRQVSFVESSPQDQLQPKLHTFSYAKPGDKIDIVKPHLFDIINQKQITVSDELFPNPWSISELRWAPNSESFTFLYNQRGHQILRIIGVNAQTGLARTIVDEQSKTFIDYSGKKYCHYVDDTNEIIWMSERDGWNHLYLYNAETNSVKNQITKGHWVVRSIEKTDDQKRQIWFFAGGLYPKQDPYYIHFCRVNFDGSGFTILTEGNGTHDINFSPDQRFFFDRWSRVDQPPVTELRNSQTGKLICTLETADSSELLNTGWQPPQSFVAKARDHQTDIYGIIIRPTNFNPDHKYPVIEQIYAGPQGAFVPKSFGLQTRQHSLAELGFIVVQIDGMGTSYRSKAFHDICWKNLGDSGFPDRIAWIKAAAQNYPCMDISRIGIYGGSAGGQSALRALLAHGDFYKVAVADCGCHDNRMDKIWWNELWMGLPVGPHYQEQSNVTQAHNLKGKLLLTVGELDRNVDPASTMQVVNALIKAKKDFELLIVPGAGHGVGESFYPNRRRMDFFVRHLLHKEPPDWNNPAISNNIAESNEN
ncbi:MAG: prolyl oligopeptidase family serine peptidase [Sedimentisphaerales bacterium]|nr:prolyl oligopeptidase family serine peptidase [Sedimentisphaerales bacterium]